MYIYYQEYFSSLQYTIFFAICLFVHSFKKKHSYNKHPHRIAPHFQMHINFMTIHNVQMATNPEYGYRIISLEQE